MLDDEHFDVDERGEIYARLPLDADQEGRGFHIYKFTVQATDQAEKLSMRRSSNTTVRSECTKQN